MTSLFVFVCERVRACAYVCVHVRVRVHMLVSERAHLCIRVLYECAGVFLLWRTNYRTKHLVVS